MIPILILDASVAETNLARCCGDLHPSSQRATLLGEDERNNLCGVRDEATNFVEPMLHPLGANYASGACKPTTVVGSKTRI